MINATQNNSNRMRLFSLLLLLVGSVSALSVASRRATTTTRISSDATTTTTAASPSTPQQKFLIHKGRSKTMILRSPSQAGLTLIENWSEDATQALSRAVEQIVEANPILRGRVYHEKKQLWIATGRDGAAENDVSDKQEFLRILPTPRNAPDFSLIQDPQERLEVLQQHLVPLFDPCELTSAQISKNLPLFGVTLVLLPNNFAVFAIQMSHAVGDGVTFFQIVKELSLFMSDLPVEHPLNWDCPAKPTHELYPPSSTKRDVDISYGAPLMLGLLKNFPFLLSRKAEFLLLPKSKVNAKKRALRTALNTTDISANDVITAAICEACRSSDLFFFTENVRHNSGPIPTMAGGNFLFEVPVSRKTAIQPKKLRQVVRQHGEYAPNTLPVMPFICGRVGRITSLATVAETLLFDGTKVVCTLPLASFIAQIPMDVAVIFRYDRQHWGVLHNFGEFDCTAKLMAEIQNGKD